MEGNDFVTGFKSGVDQVSFSPNVLSSLILDSGIDSIFIKGSSFDIQNSQTDNEFLIFNTDTNTLSIDQDADGDGAPVTIATFDNNELTAADIITGNTVI